MISSGRFVLLVHAVYSMTFTASFKCYLYSFSIHSISTIIRTSLDVKDEKWVQFVCFQGTKWSRHANQHTCSAPWHKMKQLESSISKSPKGKGIHYYVVRMFTEVLTNVAPSVWNTGRYHISSLTKIRWPDEVTCMSRPY